MKSYLERFKPLEMKPLQGLKDLSRIAATEGIVLLKNDQNVLPIQNEKINVFGRIQTNYYKSGTGSGGLVNVDYTTSIIEALKENPWVEVNPNLLNTYLEWEKDHPFNAGSGMWASEPWSQVEMPLSDTLLEQAKSFSETAIICVGRTAGEDKDNSLSKGSYYLSDLELEMIEKVSKTFKKVVVVLNVGNIMDLSFMDHNPIQGLLYVWHGGQEGGRAVADILTGVFTPSGKLPDTIAYEISDYPSSANFGGHDENIYQEDIFVGYRYFETFKPQAVRYPFGFGLSYTEFDYHVKETTRPFEYEIEVKNIGNYPGKAVVQAYVKAPQGLLGKPVKVLVGFVKTPLLAPGASETVYIHFNKYDFASYDETGVTGYASAYVLEKGFYQVTLSTDVKNDISFFEYEIRETELIEAAHEAMRPIKPFNRMKAMLQNDKVVLTEEAVPLRTYTYKNRIAENQPKEIQNTCLEKRELIDVYEHKVSLDAFVSQFSLTELSEIVRGEGMSSPKVTPGTASAFGGVTDKLKAHGLPIACCSDGPSGIRMDSGMPSTSLPNGTLLASTFNTQLLESLYYLIGIEMLSYQIDILLGPGMNIHRHPLCGRNFEYFSEDPILTGDMATAIIHGLQAAGVTGTLKHLAANNQEYRRFDADSIVSERALREIYLKGFERAVRKAHAKAIMTSYNPINGIWAASNYDLNTLIVRKEWGFKGIIMTDWWAKMNDETSTGDKANTKAMIQSQNDLYMVVQDALTNSMNDNTMASFKDGSLTKGEAQRVAKNICHYLIDSPTFRRMHAIDFKMKAPHYFIPILEGIKVNGELLTNFDPLVGHYVIKAKNYFTVEAISDEKHDISIKKNANTTLITVSNGVEQNTYLITNLERVKATESISQKVQMNKVVIVNTLPWGKTKLDLTNPLYQNEGVHLKGSNVELDKDGLLSFGIEVPVYGKYIVELSISSEQSSLAQMPLSILLGDTVASTLTTNGTDGKTIHISTQIIIQQGKFLFSIKALRTGLSISRLELIRHQ
ncbi:glycoside hydrolase family 3 C-terminal domain-containing protein [Acholeplasma vituli]|uniref:Glycoside hydrolase family 3 C-terminal domain-containing protein n=1 Tax=Paracholeplasma vituli TaxID=69473 RepID=A0ABT2PVV9_9MOLU|nr:glycoside hydrolase family 3 protein [Paracholeplasma vituli]MCU0105089.1 glycoside hydrolase family 3 C-terminal domain-containing protein [Paracholeplasma vituli]